MEETIIREALAGYQAAYDVIQRERAAQLASLTLEHALEIARDLDASWEASAHSQADLHRLEVWRLETKLLVRRAFELMARSRGLI